MCKEDIRVQRLSGNVSVGVSGPITAAAQKMLPFDPNRYAIAGGATINTTLGNKTAGCLAANVNGVLVPFLPITDETPAGNVDLSDIGALITYEIWAVDFGSTAPTVYQCAGMSFNDTLDNI
jgi:hypothetical protein